jgi:adenosine deaminase
MLRRRRLRLESSKEPTMSTIGLGALRNLACRPQRWLTSTRRHSSLAGPAAAALRSLTPTQLSFIQQLPKAELHAHLNGSIPVSVLLELARAHRSSKIQAGLKRLENINLAGLDDFFALFPAIYELTSTPPALAHAARGVLSAFLDGDLPQCTYLELRSTPRATAAMTRAEYAETVVTEVERYPEDKAALIVSVSRTMSELEVEECVSIARALKAKGRRIVGVDLCGDPLVRNQLFILHAA